MPTIQDMNAQTISIDSLGLAATVNNTQDKVSLLTNKVQEKVSTLAGKWEPALIESFPDADSPQMVGITGSKGKGGDLTGQLTEDRDPGFDAYERAHPNDPYRNTSSAEMKYERQRQRLETDPEFAAKIGVKDIKNITDDDIARAGTWEQLMGLYNAIPGTKAAWEPGPLDYYDKNRGLELGSKENPLNIPVERRDTGSIDYFGRHLAEIRNKDTGVTTKQALGYDGTEDVDYSAAKAKASLAAQGKLTPELAAYLDKNEKYVTNPIAQVQQSTTKTPMYSEDEFAKKWEEAELKNKGYMGNLVDAAQYGIGRTAATIGDAIADAVVTDSAANWLKGKGVDESWIKDGNVTVLDKYKTAKEYGYDDRRIQEYTKEVKDTFNSDKSSWADKAVVLLKGVTHAPEVFASSFGDMLAAATGVPGLVALAAGQTNEVLENRVKNKGTADLNAQDYAIAAASGIAYAAVNMFTKGNAGLMETKKVLTEAAKNMDKNTFAQLVTKVAEGIAVEGWEEIFQGVTEVVGSKIATPKEGEILTKDTALDLLAQGALGSGAGAVGGVISGVPMPERKLSSKQKEVLDKEETTSELTPEEKNSIAEFATNLAEGKVDFKADPTGIMNEIYKHEELLTRAKEGDSKRDAQAELTKAKAQISKILDEMDEETPLTFGSRKDAENFIGYAVENSIDEKGQLAEEVDRKLSKIANKAGLDEKAYKRIKDSYTVQLEAEEGRRGYTTYAREIQTLLADESADPKRLAKKVKNATDYLASQERYVTELEAGIERANDLIAAANKPGGVLTSKQVKIEVEQKVGTSKWTINIEQDTDGKYKINQATMNLLEAKKGNVAGIREALKGTSKELKAKGIEVAEEGFSIPTAESNKHEELRKADRSYYESRGVNKVILGDKTTKKWKYYKTGNESVINTGEYSKDDVVLVNTTSLEDYKDSKGKIRKLLPKKIQAEIKKAVKAGAKIVLDRDMLPVRGNDQASQKAYGAVRKLLTRYVGSDNLYANPISEETGKRQTGTFMPKEAVEKINVEAKKKFEETKKQQKAVKEAEASIDALVVDKLVNGTEVKVKAKDYEVLKDKYKAEDSKEAIGKIVRAAQTRVRAKINAAITEMSKDTAFSIIDEDTYMYTNEVMKIIGDDENMFKLLEITMDVRRAIAKDVNGKLNRLKMLKAEALETGDTTELEEFYAENSDNNEGKRILEDSYSSGAEDLYLYKTKEDGKVTKTVNKESIPNKVVWQTAIPRDINKIAKVGNVTALNLAPLDELGSKELEVVTDTAVKALKEVVGSLKDEKAAGQNSVYWLYDSPARGLLFDKDGNVNKTTAAAMVLGLGELLQNNGYMMTDGYKSADDLANMLGLDNAFGISKEVRKLIGDKGMLHNTAVDSLSKAIVAQLGLVSGVGKDYDAQAFDALRADLASMALLIGMNKNVGMLELTKVPQRQYVKTVLDVKDVSGISENAMVNFVRAKTTVDSDGKKVFIKSTQHLLDSYKVISEQMPLETSLRKEPSLHPLSKGEIKAAVKSIRKDLADMNIPKEAVQALEGLMNQEWIADVELVKEAVELVKEYPAVVGYVNEDSKEFRDMMYDERDSQVAINRDIDKAVSELDKLVDGKDVDVPLWFKWFYTKNQRYMLDANTVNPQTGKQLERFLIYPKSFKKELKVVKGDEGYKFERDGQDVTLEIKASIAQGMGFGIDKKHSDKAKQVVDNLLKMSPEMFVRFKQQLLAKKKVEGTTNFEVYKRNAKGEITEEPEDAVEVHAEIEHFGHALQALKVIEAVVNKQKIKSPLSAEYDAVTSGFGIKGFQFPLNTAEKGKEAEYKHLERVGFFIRKGEKFGPKSKFGDKEILTPEVFGDKVINDSYEGLGLGMPNKDEFTKNRSKYFNSAVEQKGDNKNLKTIITRNMTDARWAKIVEVIPSKDADGSITKALRTIFKYPFMTFNYASALKSVRKLLANSLTESMLKDMYYAEDGDKKWNDFAEVVVGAMRLDYKGGKARQYLKELLNDKSASDIKIEIGNTNLFEFVSTIVNMSVGEEAEGIFKKEFGDYIYTQKVVTNAFTAVAEVFTMEYEARLKELRSKGPVTKAQLKELLASLKDKFPAVAGPLSGSLDDNDGIAIIDSVKVTPGDSAYKGRDEAQTKFAKEAGKLLGTGDQQAINAHYKIKKFAAAISAGAVVPIHAIDGAMMAKLINWCKKSGIDIVAIHDAIIVAPEHTLKVTQKYNELMYEVNKDYNLLGELKNLVDRTLGGLDMNDTKYKREMKVAMLDEHGKDFKVGNHSLKDFINEVRNNLDKAVKENNKAREELFATIEKYGASSNHMASLPGGSYQIKASGEIEAGVKAKNSKIAQELNVSEKDINRVMNKFEKC